MMKGDMQTSLAIKIKMLRLESGQSQEQLASKIGVSRSCLANYETGKRQPDNDTLVRLADCFHVLTDYLLDRAEYRCFDLTEQEISEFIQIKHKLSGRNMVLDLSVLDIPGRVAVLQYYDFLETLSQLKQEIAASEQS